MRININIIYQFMLKHVVAKSQSSYASFFIKRNHHLSFMLAMINLVSLIVLLNSGNVCWIQENPVPYPAFLQELWLCHTPKPTYLLSDSFTNHPGCRGVVIKFISRLILSRRATTPPPGTTTSSSADISIHTTSWDPLA